VATLVVSLMMTGINVLRLQQQLQRHFPDEWTPGFRRGLWSAALANVTPLVGRGQGPGAGGGGLKTLLALQSQPQITSFSAIADGVIYLGNPRSAAPVSGASELLVESAPGAAAPDRRPAGPRNPPEFASTSVPPSGQVTDGVRPDW